MASTQSCGPARAARAACWESTGAHDTVASWSFTSSGANGLGQAT